MLGSSCSVAYRLMGRFGGMKIYETMRRRQPRFFIESGDSLYSDDPIKAEVIAESGQVWTNRVNAGSRQGGGKPGRIPRPLQIQSAG
ncbi:hypothetical protein [Methylomonas rivi]|uniref:Transposase n=1 Tax=Methylomonas rivi TaxID=2952226 RepID=A0ABT1U831_9GAMM|nr:hypothetical protein [Methylomonas sp. WSC-6]MCQ8130007.1 hypothetical protein [Methylomonas sp. WSC-6]